jgi:hypothetical protein
MRYRSIWTALAVAGLFLGACSKDKQTSLFDRKADNSLTRMVDTGVNTMNQAQTNVDKMNANTAQQENEMKDVSNQQ